MASITFDLPEPFGPTTAVIPGSKLRVDEDANDLKPRIVRLFRYTRIFLEFSLVRGRGHRRWNCLRPVYLSPLIHWIWAGKLGLGPRLQFIEDIGPTFVVNKLWRGAGNCGSNVLSEVRELLYDLGKSVGIGTNCEENVPRIWQFTKRLALTAEIQRLLDVFAGDFHGIWTSHGSGLMQVPAVHHGPVHSPKRSLNGQFVEDILSRSTNGFGVVRHWPMNSQQVLADLFTHIPSTWEAQASC